MGGAKLTSPAPGPATHRRTSAGRPVRRLSFRLPDANFSRSVSLTVETPRTRSVRPHPTVPESDSAWISINAVRALAMDAVEQAQSGHPGTPMALAPAAFVLWTRFLKHNPADPAWPDRDRFVLSCGHASML